MKLREIATILFIVVVSLLMARQGLNMMDDGFLLTTYQQVFSHPESVSYFFLYYWLNLLGGVWHCVFSDAGIYGFRVLECLAMGIVVAVGMRLLKRFFSTFQVCMGMLLVFCFTKEVGVLHYNTLTSLVTLVVIVFMMKALMSHRWVYMLVAGIAMGIDFFVRLPNVALSIFISVLIPYYIYTREKRFTMVLLAAAIIGTFVGVGVTFLVMVLLGHLDCFSFAWQSGVSLFQHADSSHSSSHLLFVFFSDLWMLSKQLLLFAVLPLLLIFVHRLLHQKSIILLLDVLFLFIQIILLKHFLYPIYALNMLVVASCIYLSYERRSEPALIYLAVLVSLTVLFMPFGCDFGLLNMQQCSLWLGGAFVVTAFQSVFKRMDNNFSDKAFIIKGRLLIIIYAIVFLGKTLYAYSYPMFYENGNRLQTVYQVDWPRCDVLTTQESANELVEIMQAMSGLVKENDELLIYPYVPMLHYLTNTRPYMRNPLPWIYNDALFEEQLTIAQEHQEDMPVVVWQKSQLNAWTTPDKDWNSPDAEESYNQHNNQKRDLKAFLHRNHYQVVWENHLFQIWKSMP